MVVKEVEFLNSNLNGIINILKDNYILINLYNSVEKVGYMETYFHGTKKITLENIYCIDKYRGNKVGSTLLDISDYLLKDYIGYTLCGVYYPCQMLDDIKILRDPNELDMKARSFYLKHGFDIVSFSEYESDKDKYPLININDFSPTIKKFRRSVVYKKISKLDNYRFKEKDNKLYEEVNYE